LGPLVFARFLLGELFLANLVDGIFIDDACDIRAVFAADALPMSITASLCLALEQQT